VDELADPVTGSTTTACVECGDDIWISAASRKEMGRVGAMPLCSRCAVRIAADTPLGEFGTPSEGQMKEVIEQLVELHPEWKPALAKAGNVDAFEALKITASMLTSVMETPDADWGLILVIESYDKTVYPPVPLSEMLGAGIPKEIVARQLIPAMLQAANARRAMLGLSSWTLSSEGPVELTGPISEHPDRKENLVLIEVTADGVQQVSFAEISRDGVSPPTLGEWQDIDSPEQSDGLFVDALIPTLQLIRTLHDS
jgi:hypothetical protein